MIVGGGGPGVLALAGVAVAPTFLPAGLGIIVRAAAVGAQWTAQQSFLQGCIAPGLRATATSVALGCWGLATALLPLPAGQLLDHHLLVWPLVLGVACYAGAVCWFWLTLRGTALPEEEDCETDTTPTTTQARAAR